MLWSVCCSQYRKRKQHVCYIVSNPVSFSWALLYTNLEFVKKFQAQSINRGSIKFCTPVLSLLLFLRRISNFCILWTKKHMGVFLFLSSQEWTTATLSCSCVVHPVCLFITEVLSISDRYNIRPRSRFHDMAFISFCPSCHPYDYSRCQADMQTDIPGQDLFSKGRSSVHLGG